MQEHAATCEAMEQTAQLFLQDNGQLHEALALSPTCPTFCILVVPLGVILHRVLGLQLFILPRDDVKLSMQLMAGIHVLHRKVNVQSVQSVLKPYCSGTFCCFIWERAGGSVVSSQRRIYLFDGIFQATGRRQQH